MIERHPWVSEAEVGRYMQWFMRNMAVNLYEDERGYFVRTTVNQIGVYWTDSRKCFSFEDALRYMADRTYMNDERRARR